MATRFSLLWPPKLCPFAPRTMTFADGLESTQGGAIPCEIKHLGVLSTTYSQGGAGTPETMTVGGQEAPGTMSFGPRNYDL